ncbi:MAG: SLC13 family permease, partial [Anaerolineae bacterium]|nr:SLC13 family permease [Anaerolineae bacterium]
MTVDIAIFLVLFLVGLVLFATERFPADVTALGLMLSLVLLGLLEPTAAFAGFGSETVMMILGLLILTEMLIYTGLVDAAGRWMLALVGGRLAWMRAVLLIAPAIFSSFISNTASAAFFLPIALGFSRRSGISASRLLMPLAFTAILAGSVTLIGTSTNLVVSGLMQQAGLVPLGMFELTPVGLPILLVGILYMALIGNRLIPDRTGALQSPRRMDDDLYFTEIRIPEESSLIGISLEDTGLLDELKLGMLRLQRDGENLPPLAHTILQARDILLVEGTRENMLRLMQTPGLEISGKINELEDYMKQGTGRIAEVVILPGSALNGRTIKGLRLRERYQVQILAVNQGGDIRHNRIGKVTFKVGDVLLVKMPQVNMEIVQRERLFRVLDIVDVQSLDVGRLRKSSVIFVGAMALAISG